jgi:hypothetical protein
MILKIKLLEVATNITIKIGLSISQELFALTLEESFGQKTNIDERETQ